MFGRKTKPEKISLYEEEAIYEPVEKIKNAASVTPVNVTKKEERKVIDSDDFIFEYTKLCFGKIKHKHDDNNKIIEKFKKHECFRDEEALELLYYRLNETLYEHYENEFLGIGTYQFLNHFNSAKSNEEKIISVIEVMDAILYSMVHFNYKETGELDNPFKEVYKDYFNKNTFPPFINMTVTIITNDLIYQFLLDIAKGGGDDVSLLDIITAYITLTQSFYEQLKSENLENNPLIQKIIKFFILR